MLGAPSPSTKDVQVFYFAVGTEVCTCCCLSTQLGLSSTGQWSELAKCPSCGNYRKITQFSTNRFLESGGVGWLCKCSKKISSIHDSQSLFGYYSDTFWIRFLKFDKMYRTYEFPSPATQPNTP